MRHDLALESQIEIDFPIDVVFTWVDDSDPAWQTRYQHYKQLVNEGNVGKHATDPARFSNYDELKYSLGSVLKFLPWVRRSILYHKQASGNVSRTPLIVRIVSITRTLSSHNNCLRSIPM